jgi:hypothetical protein
MLRRAISILFPVITMLVACSSPTRHAADTDLTIPPPPDPIVISGVVADAYDHHSLDGAVITLTGGDQVLADSTDQDGYYAFSDGLTPGEYRLRCRKAGYVVVETVLHIPSLEELKGDIDNPPAGVLPYSARHDFYLVPVR